MIRLLLALASLGALPGCGEESREFAASEVIDELSDNGAPLRLGGPSPNEQEGIEIHELSISGPDPEHSTGEHVEEGASLIVAVDERTAEDEFVRCESTVSLTCYRVANAVLLFTGDDPETLARIEAAVRAMESE